MRIDDILGKLDKVKQAGRGFTALCPSHDDHERSLSIRESDTGKVLVKCFAGCETTAVTAAMGLKWVTSFQRSQARPLEMRKPQLIPPITGKH